MSLLAASILACGGGAGSSLATDDDSPNTGTAVGGNVTGFEIVNGVATVDLSNLADADEAVVFIYTANESSTAEAYEIGPSLNKDTDWFILSSFDEAESVLNPAETFEAMLRSSEAQLDRSLFLTSKQPSMLKQARADGERTFKVLNSFNSTTSYETVTADLIYEGSNFLFYLDERDVGSITDAHIAELAEMFEELVPVERELLDGQESDVNGDGKFVVLFTRVVNELGGNSGGIVTGFFYAADLFDQYEVSNEMEIFYTLVPDGSGELGTAISEDFLMSNIYQGVLPHEYQHMINFNMHYNINGGSTESSWLNEASSHLIEDLVHRDADNYMSASGPENPSRVEVYLEQVESTCFTCGTSLGQRGGSYLFLRYLYEQAELGNLVGVVSGADLLGRLGNTSLTGFDNLIQAAFGASGTDDDLLDAIGLFGLAVYLSNTDLTTDDRLGFNGINLRTTQNDNRETVLNGPSIQTASSLPFTDTLSGTSLGYIGVTGALVDENGGSISLTVSDGALFGGYVIQ